MVKRKLTTIKKPPKLKPRPKNGHKGTFGKVTVIAGSVGMTGAAALAGKAALRAGSGLVRIATAESALPIVASLEPSYTTSPLPQDKNGRISKKAINKILNLSDKNDCIAIGPGLGISAGLQDIIENLIKQKKLRIVIDGDGLNNLAGITDFPGRIRADVVLTPHPGEFKRLFKAISREKMPRDRQEQALRLAKVTKSTIVLKGAGTVVTDAQKIYVNTTGNPGMATAGSGDILTGVITALMGQNLSSFDAAVLGVHLHGLAGDIAAQKLGQISIMATDILDSLPAAFTKKQ